MTEALAWIDRLMYDHRVVRQCLEKLRESRLEEELLFMKKIQERDVTKLQAIVDKQFNLLYTLVSLIDGLADHATFEETKLPMLAGDLLPKALAIEHAAVLEEFNKIRVLLTGKESRTLNRDELLTRSYELGFATERICQLIESHMAKEDSIYELLKIAMEKAGIPEKSSKKAPAFPV